MGSDIRPHAKEAEYERSQFGGSFLFVRTPFITELPNFNVVTHVGEERVSWDQPHAPYPN